MTLTAFFFYLFATLTVASAFMVITARNPVHAVLFLILCFFNAAGLFLLLGAEFLAMILVVVYVGAVAVLFLFVVMMLDVDFAELRAGFIKNASLGALVGLLVLAEIVMVVASQLWTPGVLPTGVIKGAPMQAGRDQHHGHRAGPLYEVHVLLPDRGDDPARRDDRRHRTHVARAAGCAAPEYLGAERALEIDRDGCDQGAVGRLHHPRQGRCKGAGVMAYTNGSGKPPEPERKTNITSLEEVRKRAEAEAKAKMKKAQPAVPMRERLIGIGLIGIAVATVVAWLLPMFGSGVGR